MGKNFPSSIHCEKSHSTLLQWSALFVPHFTWTLNASLNFWVSDQWNGDGNIQKAFQGLWNFLLFFIMTKKKKTRYVRPYAFYSNILPMPAFVASSLIFWCLWGVGLHPLPRGPSKTVSTSEQKCMNSKLRLGRRQEKKKKTTWSPNLYTFHVMKTNYKIRMHYHNCLYLCFKEFAVFWI